MAKECVADGILFDLDGTLINTIECTEKIYREYAEIYNVDIEKLLDFSHGIQTIAVLKKFFPEDFATNESVIEMEDKALKDASGVHLVPGTLEFLQKIPKSCWGIVTSGTHIMAKTRMGQMGIEIPKCFFTADIVPRSKPFPDGYISCAKSLGFDPKNCVVFEDAPAGVKAGIDAGCFVIGVISSHTEKQLIDSGVSFCISSYDQLDVKIIDGKIHLSLKN
ncbi:Sugar phosphatase YfbT [Smittium culicis]|uniref:Sugar phosphatase YfbT n=1 Tax=Smittium culicis TaxID=133412 RepID=A0A1R1XX93_9FUNG|nr:Sugar phosphatase YfbT [Smittium culicis]